MPFEKKHRKPNIGNVLLYPRKSKLTGKVSYNARLSVVVKLNEVMPVDMALEVLKEESPHLSVGEIICNAIVEAANTRTNEKLCREAAVYLEKGAVRNAF
jgi:hypothetical protein